MDCRLNLLDSLENLNISFVETFHPPVYTVEEANQYWENIEGLHCKNIFLRNKNGKKHYLIVMPSDKQLKMKSLNELIGERLSFASSERLKKWLGLEPGSVSPFGLINDLTKHVVVILDKEVFSHEKVNFHPGINTSTLTISVSDFRKFLNFSGHNVLLLDL